MLGQGGQKTQLFPCSCTFCEVFPARLLKAKGEKEGSVVAQGHTAMPLGHQDSNLVRFVSKTPVWPKEVQSKTMQDHDS